MFPVCHFHAHVISFLLQVSLERISQYEASSAVLWLSYHFA